MCRHKPAWQSLVPLALGQSLGPRLEQLELGRRGCLGYRGGLQTACLLQCSALAATSPPRVLTVPMCVMGLRYRLMSYRLSKELCKVGFCLFSCTVHHGCLVDTVLQWSIHSWKELFPCSTPIAPIVGASLIRKPKTKDMIYLDMKPGSVVQAH